MNSFNHYAYGAVGRWMYGTLSGVRPLEPGYGKILVAPQVPDAGGAGGVGRADYRLETPYGLVRSAWDVTGEGLRMTVTIPANTTGEIRVPAASAEAVLESGSPASEAEGLTFERMEDGAAVYSAGSGTYSSPPTRADRPWGLSQRGHGLFGRGGQAEVAPPDPLALPPGGLWVPPEQVDGDVRGRDVPARTAYSRPADAQAVGELDDAVGQVPLVHRPSVVSRAPMSADVLCRRTGMDDTGGSPP